MAESRESEIMIVKNRKVQFYSPMPLEFTHPGLAAGKSF